MLDDPLFFLDERAAVEKAEAIRWPEGPVCVHCGTHRQAGRVTGRGARVGLWFCRSCRRQFRVTVGTIFEGSHVPLHKWLRACLFVGRLHVNANQLHVMLRVTVRAATRMTRAIKGVLGSEPAGSLDEILRRAFEVRVCNPEAAQRAGPAGAIYVCGDHTPL